MFFSENTIHILDSLDEDLKEKAEIIAQQLIIKENLKKEKAYMVAHALAKNYSELKQKGFY